MSHHILFTIESLYPLGAAQQLKLLAAALVRQGHQVQVAVLGEFDEAPIAWTELGIDVHYLNGDDSTCLHPMRDGWTVVRDLRRLIRASQPDIVHAWCGRAELLTLLATDNGPLARSLAKPLPPIRLICTELFIQPEKGFTRKSVESRLSDRVEHMVVPHASVAQHLVDNGYRPERIQVIPNSVSNEGPPIDRNRARQALLDRLELPDSTFLAGAVAPLIHRSRLKDLVWATDLLTTIRDDFHFVIIGTGSQLARLKRFAALTEAKTHVHFLGHCQSPEQVIAGINFYWHAHLRDPLSGNLLAAMGTGLPVVSVYGEGTKEIIRPQETGFAVNFGARDEFARWTKFLIEKPEAASKLAKQGKEHALAEFAVEPMVNEYLGLYDETP